MSTGDAPPETDRPREHPPLQSPVEALAKSATAITKKQHQPARSRKRSNPQNDKIPNKKPKTDRDEEQAPARASSSASSKKPQAAAVDESDDEGPVRKSPRTLAREKKQDAPPPPRKSPSAASAGNKSGKNSRAKKSRSSASSDDEGPVRKSPRMLAKAKKADAPQQLQSPDSASSSGAAGKKPSSKHVNSLDDEDGPVRKSPRNLAKANKDDAQSVDSASSSGAFVKKPSSKPANSRDEDDGPVRKSPRTVAKAKKTDVPTPTAASATTKSGSKSKSTEPSLRRSVSGSSTASRAAEDEEGPVRKSPRNATKAKKAEVPAPTTASATTGSGSKSKNTELSLRRSVTGSSGVLRAAEDEEGPVRKSPRNATKAKKAEAPAHIAAIATTGSGSKSKSTEPSLRKSVSGPSINSRAAEDEESPVRKSPRTAATKSQKSDAPQETSSSNSSSSSSSSSSRGKSKPKNVVPPPLQIPRSSPIVKLERQASKSPRVSTPSSKRKKKGKSPARSPTSSPPAGGRQLSIKSWLTPKKSASSGAPLQSSSSSPTPSSSQSSQTTSKKAQTTVVNPSSSPKSRSTNTSNGSTSSARSKSSKKRKTAATVNGISAENIVSGPRKRSRTPVSAAAAAADASSSQSSRDSSDTASTKASEKRPPSDPKQLQARSPPVSSTPTSTKRAQPPAASSTQPAKGAQSPAASSMKTTKGSPPPAASPPKSAKQAQPSAVSALKSAPPSSASSASSSSSSSTSSSGGNSAAVVSFVQRSAKAKALLQLDTAEQVLRVPSLHAAKAAAAAGGKSPSIIPGISPEARERSLLILRLYKKLSRKQLWAVCSHVCTRDIRRKGGLLEQLGMSYNVFSRWLDHRKQIVTTNSIDAVAILANFAFSADVEFVRYLVKSDADTAGVDSLVEQLDAPYTKQQVIRWANFSMPLMERVILEQRLLETKHLTAYTALRRKIQAEDRLRRGLKGRQVFPEKKSERKRKKKKRPRPSEDSRGENNRTEKRIKREPTDNSRDDDDDEDEDGFTSGSASEFFQDEDDASSDDSDADEDEEEEVRAPSDEDEDEESDASYDNSSETVPTSSSTPKEVDVEAVPDGMGVSVSGYLRMAYKGGQKRGRPKGSRDRTRRNRKGEKKPLPRVQPPKVIGAPSMRTERRGPRKFKKRTLLGKVLTSLPCTLSTRNASCFDSSWTTPPAALFPKWIPHRSALTRRAVPPGADLFAPMSPTSSPALQSFVTPDFRTKRFKSAGTGGKEVDLRAFSVKSLSSVSSIASSLLSQEANLSLPPLSSPLPQPPVMSHFSFLRYQSGYIWCEYCRQNAKDAAECPFSKPEPVEAKHSSKEYWDSVTKHSGSRLHRASRDVFKWNKANAVAPKVDAVLNAGGCVQSVSWAPVGDASHDSSTCVQYLAVATSKRKFGEIHKDHLGEQLIQIYDFSALGVDDLIASQPGSSSPTGVNEPHLALAIIHDAQVWDMQWFPRDCWQPPEQKHPDAYSRLGLLAVADGRGHLTIYSVPHPHSVSPAHTNARVSAASGASLMASIMRSDPDHKVAPVPILCRLRPVVRVELPSARMWRVRFHTHPDQRVLAAGGTDGTISLFDMDQLHSSYTVPPSSVSRSGAPSAPPPRKDGGHFASWQAHLRGKPINDITWSSDDPSLFVSFAQDMTLYLWDIRMLPMPVSNVKLTHMVQKMSWVPGTEVVLLCPENGQRSPTISLLHIGSMKTDDLPKENSFSFANTCSGIWDADVMLMVDPHTSRARNEASAGPSKRSLSQPVLKIIFAHGAGIVGTITSSPSRLLSPDKSYFSQIVHAIRSAASKASDSESQTAAGSHGSSSSSSSSSSRASSAVEILGPFQPRSASAMSQKASAGIMSDAKIPSNVELSLDEDRALFCTRWNPNMRVRRTFAAGGVAGIVRVTSRFDF